MWEEAGRCSRRWQGAVGWEEARIDRTSEAVRRGSRPPELRGGGSGSEQGGGRVQVLTC